MIEQINNDVKFLAFFVASKVGKTGLSDVTVDVYDPAGSEIVTAGAGAEIGDGLYSYTLTANLVTTVGEYPAVFKTADATVDAQHIPALWVVGRAGVENLDATVSGVPVGVWNDLQSNHPDLGSGTIGEAFNVIAFRTDMSLSTMYNTISSMAYDVWNFLLSDYWSTTDNVSGGKMLKAAAADPSTIAAGVWDADKTNWLGQTNTFGEALVTLGSVSDPLLNPVPGSYPTGSAGEVLGRIGVADIVTQGPVSADGGTLTLVRGDDYTLALNREISFSSMSWPDLNGALEVAMTVRRRREAFGTGSDSILINTEDDANSRVVSTSPQTVVFELGTALTTPLLPGLSTGKFDVQAILSDNSVVTLVTGLVNVTEDQTRTNTPNP